MFDDGTSDNIPSEIEGEMTFASMSKAQGSRPGDAHFSTLDEPIKQTFVRHRNLHSQNDFNFVLFFFSFVMQKLLVSNSFMSCIRMRKIRF